MHGASWTVYMSNIRAIHFYQYICGYFSEIILKRYGIFISLVNNVVTKKLFTGFVVSWKSSKKHYNLMHFDVIYYVTSFTTWRHLSIWTKRHTSGHNWLRRLKKQERSALFTIINLANLKWTLIFNSRSILKWTQLQAVWCNKEELLLCVFMAVSPRTSSLCSYISWFGIMDCMLFTFENRVLLMRKGGVSGVASFITTDE